MKKYYVLFIIMFFLPTFMFLLIPIRGQKNISKMESRTLKKIPSFEISDFLDGSFQDDLESGMQDQLLLSQSIKKKIKQVKNKFNEIVINTFVKNNDNNCNKYIEVVEGYYNYNCSDYLIEKPSKYDKNNFNHYKEIYNSINADKYIYYIEKDRSVDFTNLKQKDILYNDMKDAFNYKKISRFALNSYDDLEKYFYQTDHHWNYKGSYKGYTEMIKMLKGDKEKLLKPVETKTFDIIFNGSASRKSLTSTSHEKFTIYTFKDLNYKCYINDEEKEYGNRKKYFDGKISQELYENHYGVYYGGDFAKIVYDFNDDSKENLMIIATSYSNAVNDLIASHFNQTHVIDLRYYKSKYKEDIDFNKYIKENNIDKVLIMGDIYSFMEDDKNAL